MKRRVVYLQIGKGRGTLWHTVLAMASTAVVVLGVTALFIVLAPLIGILIAVALGIALGAIIVGGLWWLFFGRKLVRKMRQDMENMAAQARGENPRRHVNVHVHEEDE